MTKTESAHLTAQTVLIESAEEALQISGAAGVRLAIPDTDALIMVGPADWIAKNLPGVEAMVAEPVKTWRERLPAGVGISFDYAHICAMKAEIAELRTRLAATTQASTAQAEPDGWIAPAYIAGELTSVAFKDIENACASCAEGEPVAFLLAIANSTYSTQAAAEVRKLIRLRTIVEAVSKFDPAAMAMITENEAARRVLALRSAGDTGEQK